MELLKLVLITPDSNLFGFSSGQRDGWCVNGCGGFNARILRTTDDLVVD